MNNNNNVFFNIMITKNMQKITFIFIYKYSLKSKII